MDHGVPGARRRHMVSVPIARRTLPSIDVSASYTSTELVTIIGVLFTALTGLVAAVFAGLAAIRTAKVHQEVKTMNGLRMGELADAAETRRIEEKPAAERTAAEEQHVDVVPPEEP